jgi:hypothetical protein
MKSDMMTLRIIPFHFMEHRYSIEYDECYDYNPLTNAKCESCIHFSRNNGGYKYDSITFVAKCDSKFSLTKDTMIYIKEVHQIHNESRYYFLYHINGEFQIGTNVNNEAKQLLDTRCC